MGEAEAHLKGLLDTATQDPRTASPEAFAAWLADRLEDASRDPVYQQRSHIRRLMLDHRSPWETLRAQVDSALDAYASTPAAAAIGTLTRALHHAERAVAGLDTAVQEGRADATKLDAARVRHQEVTAELAATTAASAEHTKLRRAERALADLEEHTGLTAARAELKVRQRAQGHRASRLGGAYEAEIQELLRERFERQLATAILLTGVTLRASRGEFDALVVHVPGDPDAVVEVLAAVEIKRNPNDLGHGFAARQEHLAWLTSTASAFDPELYRNRHYPTGRFEGVVHHRAGGRRYAFGPESFRRFTADDDGAFLDHLWFVTEARPLVGASTRELQSLLHRVSTDLDFDAADPSRVEALRRWFVGRASPVQATDVLRRYLSSGRSGQIRLTRPQTPDGSRR